jgi:septal ring factor EnvC (AmiA/AmiB activator)
MAMIKLHPVHATPPLRSMAVEAQRKLEDSRKQTAQLQQQRHSLLQERKAAEEEVANMKLQLREARDALTASHRATKDVMIDYLRALRDAEARAMPHQGTHSEKKKNLKSALPL